MNVSDLDTGSLQGFLDVLPGSLEFYKDSLGTDGGGSIGGWKALLGTLLS